MSKLNRKYQDDPTVQDCPVEIWPGSGSQRASQYMVMGMYADLPCVQEDAEYCVPKILEGDDTHPFAAFSKIDTYLADPAGKLAQVCDPCAIKFVRGE